ncbi:MAG TPA: pyridoxamine 5'-phosphate oxidase family protein [Candidatus Paceibacterota bacterium]|nr:pyridoxamine 5'-phosphate oxidase family protein [Candidatus Paceibacterota bacterium]
MSNPLQIKALVREVFEQGRLMSLGFADAGGPWVADVLYIHDDDFNIYWISHPNARHSKAALTHPQMAGTITIDGGSGADNKGLQFAGEVKRLVGLRYDLGVKHFKKRGKPAPKVDFNFLEGRSWYVLKPSLIELIHEKHFGFDKQKLEL